jgi:hypothetical protein
MNFGSHSSLTKQNKTKLMTKYFTVLASSAGISPVESGGGKKFGEMPAINRHKNLHCAYRLARANFDKLKLRGSRKGLRQGVKKFLFSTRWLTRRVKL